MRRSAERTNFLNCLLVDVIEGGMTGQWGEIYAVKRDEKLNIISCKVTDSIDPIKEKPQVWEVTIETMAKGLSLHSKDPKFSEQGMGGEGLTLANKSNGEDGDYDAIDADAVLQVGLFGEVIYG